ARRVTAPDEVAPQLMWVGLTVVTLLAFALLWARLASLPAWSDETTHMAAAYGLLKTGEPFLVDFDRCAVPLPLRYLRGFEITWLTAQSYRVFGTSLAAARSVPVVFIVLA